MNQGSMRGNFNVTYSGFPSNPLIIRVPFFLQLRVDKQVPK